MTNIDKAKGIFDWFLGKNNANQVLLILMAIIGVLGYFSYLSLQETKAEVNLLRGKIVTLETMVSELTIENFKLKYNPALMSDSDKDDPNPQWITNAEDNTIMWINKAYIKRYLEPKGLGREDLIGTTGKDIFGEKTVNRFIANNELVKRLGRPINFNNEVNKTMKFPISKGGVIYAIKGAEWLDHN